jgi:hypothetical protein
MNSHIVLHIADQVARKKERRLQTDEMRSFRGVVIGILISALIWALILMGVIWISQQIGDGESSTARVMLGSFRRPSPIKIDGAADRGLTPSSSVGPLGAVNAEVGL